MDIGSFSHERSVHAQIPSGDCHFLSGISTWDSHPYTCVAIAIQFLDLKLLKTVDYRNFDSEFAENKLQNWR